MHRHFFGISIALAAVGLWMAPPARAGNDASLREKVQQLEKKVDQLSQQQSAQLEHEVDRYLESNDAWRSAQGGSMNTWDKVHLTAHFASVWQATANIDPADRNILMGDVGLNFKMNVTDNLDLFINMTGNTAAGVFGPPSSVFGLGNGFPFNFPNNGAGSVSILGSGFYTTAGGMTDGIGVNGIVATRPGDVRIQEAGIQHRAQLGETVVNWEAGEIDPRTRFGQNSLADDPYTQFLNDNFNNSPSILWLTNAFGFSSLGVHAWADVGQNKNWTISAGWFNVPGRWTDMGQMYIQLAYHGDISGRAFHANAFVCIDDFYQEVGNSGATLAIGWSADYMATDKIGVFLKGGWANGKVNPVQTDVEFGAVFKHLIDSRPDDTIGVGLAYLSLRNNSTGSINGAIPAFGTFPHKNEITIEAYYRFMAENGKLQITPHIMFVNNPGGGNGWINDKLLILGVRVYVPF